MFPIELLRDYRVPPPAVFEALEAAITASGGAVHQINTLTRTLRFTTAGLIPGGRYMAEVIPRGAGSFVHVHGTPRSASLRARNRQDRKLAEILDAVGDNLEAKV